MSFVPVAESHEKVRAIAEFVLSAGYTEAQMKQWGLTKTPWRGSVARPLLSAKIPEESVLGLLIRLFFFGEPVPLSSVDKIFPSEISNSMLSAGMLRKEGEEAIPLCMLVHFETWLIACDSVDRARSGSFNDLVLGVNRPTQILANCMLRLSELNDVLDLGTGCGTLGFEASLTAKRVIGTDINKRALEFAAFNAALNGITNFEVREGDRFEPVKDLAFDLVISNPPFFLTPTSKLLFTDNPFQLDSFVESLARTVPSSLKHGGYFQMLCEWVVLKGQPWTDRLKEWFTNSGCDVLVLKSYQITPADYAVRRATESESLHGQSSPDILLDHIQYFEERGVEMIFGGLVTIRRSSVWPDGNARSNNWFVVDDMDEIPATQIGDLILDRFAVEDVLSGSESRLLSAKPRLIRSVTLVQEAVQENRSWKPRVTYLERRGGLTRRLGFNAEIANLVALWDGEQDFDSLISDFARHKNIPKKQASQDFLSLARRLASLGLIAFN